MPKPKALSTAVESVSWRGYLSEDIREEANGRVSLMGLYPNSTIVLGMPASVPDPTPDSMAGVAGLAILLTTTVVTKPVEISLQMIDPNHRVISEGKGVLAVGEVSNLISRFRPFIVSSFGEWTWAVRGAGVDFDFKFSVNRGPIAYQPPDQAVEDVTVEKTTAAAKRRPKPAVQVPVRTVNTTKSKVRST